MSAKLRVVLFIFSFVWFVIVMGLIRRNKLPIKYSLVWMFAIFIIFLIAVIPKILEIFANAFGFLTISNLVIGILLTILLAITLVLTMLIARQKKQITLLIQEVSMLKEKNK